MPRRSNISGQNFNMRIESNVPAVKTEMKRKIGKMTYAIGLKWQSIATRLITAKRIVDTGRLRGSLTFITNKKTGVPTNRTTDNIPNDFLKGKAPAQTIVVGTNVSYAVKQEFGNPKGPYLKPSILNYKESYKNVAEHIMKE